MWSSARIETENGFRVGRRTEEGFDLTLICLISGGERVMVGGAGLELAAEPQLLASEKVVCFLSRVPTFPRLKPNFRHFAHVWA